MNLEAEAIRREARVLSVFRVLGFSRSAVDDILAQARFEARQEAPHVTETARKLLACELIISILLLMASEGRL